MLVAVDVYSPADPCVVRQVIRAELGGTYCRTVIVGQTARTKVRAYTIDGDSVYWVERISRALAPYERQLCLEFR